MDNIVRTWEIIELTDEELEVINGAGGPMTLHGNVFDQPVNVVFDVTSMSMNISGTTVTGTLFVDSNGTITS